MVWAEDEPVSQGERERKVFERSRLIVKTNNWEQCEELRELQEGGMQGIDVTVQCQHEVNYG